MVNVKGVDWSTPPSRRLQSDKMTLIGDQRGAVKRFNKFIIIQFHWLWEFPFVLATMIGLFILRNTRFGHQYNVF